MSQNLATLVKPKIAGKWMFIPLKMVSIGIDPYPYKKKVKGAMRCKKIGHQLPSELSSGTIMSMETGWWLSHLPL